MRMVFMAVGLVLTAPCGCCPGQGTKKAPSGMAPEGAKVGFAQAPLGAWITDTIADTTTETWAEA